MYELLVYGTFWFWALLALSFCVITYQVNVGNGWGSSLMFVITIAAFAFLGNSDFFLGLLKQIKENPIQIIGIFFGYLFIGAIWSIVKWYYFLLDSKKEQLDRNKRIKANSKFQIPQPSEHKSDIILWMSYWPLSALWTLIDNPFKKIFNRMFNGFEGLYKKLASHVFSDVETETETE